MTIHCEQIELGETLILVSYRFSEALAPSARTLANPMGTDDGSPPEIVIKSVRTLDGELYVPNEFELRSIYSTLFDIHEGE